MEGRNLVKEERRDVMEGRKEIMEGRKIGRTEIAEVGRKKVRKVDR
jgi:hypothetical protein